MHRALVERDATIESDGSAENVCSRATSPRVTRVPVFLSRRRSAPVCQRRKEDIAPAGVVLGVTTEGNALRRI